jgi:hypothetical protein
MRLSKRQKRKRVKPPRVKRMKRPARLQSARKFLTAFKGKNILRGYCKHFGVDWRCAAIELKRLGIEISSEYLRQREVNERGRIAQRQRRCAGYQQSEQSFVMTSFDAWLDEDYALHHQLWQMEDAASQMELPLKSDGQGDSPF